MMRRLISVVCAGLLASTAHAATVSILPSPTKPNVGDAFTLTVRASAMPQTGGATLGLSWTSSVVRLDGISLTPVPGVPPVGSPFNVVEPVSANLDEQSDGKIEFLTWLAPTSGTLPSGDFNVIDLKFTRIGPAAGLVALEDNGGVKSWSDPNALPIPGVVYEPAVIEAIPLPASLFLFAPVLAGLAATRRRRSGG